MGRDGRGKEGREREKGRGCAVVKFLKICPGNYVDRNQRITTKPNRY